MWTEVMLRALTRLTLVASLSALLCLPAHAATQPWSTLTPMQQEALAPIAHEWSTMPEIQQKRLLATTKRYPQLSPKKKQLFLTRLTEWSKLTPEQRNRAREKYKAYSKVPADKREEMKRMVLQREAEKMAAAAASDVAPTTPLK
jgi:hypothetical protein